MNDRTPVPHSGAQPPGGGCDDSGTGLRHLLYPYEGEKQFLDGALAFIDQAVNGGEHVLVAVAPPREQLLRDALTRTGRESSVSYVDLTGPARNPARLIPAWREWVGKRATDGQGVRAIGENPWQGRSAGETSELRYHEWLLNQAFARAPAWWLLCPCDTSETDPDVLSALGRCHPLVLEQGAAAPSPDFVDEPYAFDDLPPPCGGTAVAASEYGPGELHVVRDRVAECARRHGVDGGRLRDLLIAVTEVAANSIRHGGGRGSLKLWAERGRVVCEFHDAGHISDPLAGRVRPSLEQNGGRGLWLVQQLCDLVQIRSDAESGTTIRLQMTSGG
jgi:anti-sigma regulatory factor (Ser/Thr protein kinase)